MYLALFNRSRLIADRLIEDILPICIQTVKNENISIDLVPHLTFHHTIHSLSTHLCIMALSYVTLSRLVFNINIRFCQVKIVGCNLRSFQLSLFLEDFMCQLNSRFYHLQMIMGFKVIRFLISALSVTKSLGYYN